MLLWSHESIYSGKSFGPLSNLLLFLFNVQVELLLLVVLLNSFEPIYLWVLCMLLQTFEYEFNKPVNLNLSLLFLFIYYFQSIQKGLELVIVEICEGVQSPSIIFIHNNELALSQETLKALVNLIWLSYMSEVLVWRHILNIDWAIWLVRHFAI